jgi:hypothetical protein
MRAVFVPVQERTTDSEEPYARRNGVTFTSYASVDTRHLGTVKAMTPDRDHGWVTHFFTVPRAAALVLFLMAIGSFLFIIHKPYTGPIYSPARDRESVLNVAGYVYDGVEAGPSRTGLPVPVAHTVDLMSTAYKNNGVRVHVFVHGAHVMVTFPKEPAVCVWVPVIVNGPKQPSIVSC